MTLAIENEITPLKMDKYGTIRVGDTRVTLDLVINAFNEGALPQQIVKMYSALDLADTYYAIGYYLRHKAEIDAYIKEGEETADKLGEELQVRYGQAELKQKLEARKSLQG
ncbi:MAG: DUF433 domain-containing protein [Chloroflexi bacterium]|nr:DUF433 domain-containing protein [Chloroflexota bacterium]OJW02091.1 MAG: hypothetical protein BGO39_27805 [Chloroflexi bacterium 54-19]